jgi:hypothetical protein
MSPNKEYIKETWDSQENDRGRLVIKFGDGKKLASNQQQ